MKKIIISLSFLLLFASQVKAQRYFIRFVGGSGTNIAIAGDSPDATFKGSEGFSEISTVEFEMINSINIFTASSQNFAGKAESGIITFSKQYTPLMSTKLSLALSNGGNYNSIEIVGTQPDNDGKPVAFVKYTFDTAIFANVKKAFKTGDDPSVIESYSFKSKTFSIKYRQWGPSGVGGSDASCFGFGWDFSTNTEVPVTGLGTNCIGAKL